MAVMDSNASNVALPTIAQDFKTDAATSTWVISIYQLAIVALLLPLASLGEIVGYRRVYIAGLLIFTSASIGSAMSETMTMLIISRGFQGLGAAGVMSVNLALIRHIFPSARLGRAIGINAVVVAIAATIGPTVAGAILSIATWPWIFAINIPLGCIAILVGWHALPENLLSKHRFDGVSAILNTLTFCLLITAIAGFGQEAPGWIIGGQLAVSVTAGVLLVRRQKSLQSPLLPVDLIRRPIFAFSLGTAVLSYIAQMTAFVSLPFHLQSDLGLTAADAGLVFTPWPLAAGLAAPLAGWLSDRHSAGILCTFGLIVMAIGLVLLACLPDTPSYCDVIWRMAICGFGFGFFQSPNNRTLISSAPRERSGGASGALATARVVGQATGTTLAALMLSHVIGTNAAAALVVSACFCIAGAAISALRLTRVIRSCEKK
jgi:DHA2 family multidrug resistance protein-like MFS transporter